MRHLGPLLARSAVAILPVLACAGCQEAAPPALVRPVLTTTVRSVASEVFGPFASTVEARYQTQLGFQLAGRMVSRAAFVGDTVHKGQKLAALDPVVVQFALLRAKADIGNAEAQLRNAEGIEQRQRSLAAGGNVARATLDSAVAGRDTARARLDQAQAALRIAEAQIGYTELTANFDGVVTAWTAEIGQYVDNGQAVMTLARPDIREAVVDIPDDLVGRVSPGMPFSVRLQAAPDIVAQAVVREIGPLADEATRTHRVRLTLRNPSPAFRLGTTISVSHESATAPSVTLPATAALTEGVRTAVWLLAADGRSVVRRTVTVADRRDGSMRVTAGLSDGDRVVTVGVHSLTDGQAVAGTIEEGGANPLKVGDARL